MYIFIYYLISCTHVAGKQKKAFRTRFGTKASGHLYGANKFKQVRMVVSPS